MRLFLSLLALQEVSAIARQEASGSTQSIWHPNEGTTRFLMFFVAYIDDLYEQGSIDDSWKLEDTSTFGI